MIYRCLGKRVFDLALSIPALVVFSPVLLGIGLLVRLKLGSPVLFRQERLGLNGRLFMIDKFRTMTDEHDEGGHLLPDAQRLTKFGRVLRSTSLDELPELFNVLKGEMSIVGPRPLLMRYSPYFTEDERLRFSVKPGITGLAQISGRNDLNWDQRMATDVRYVNELSFALDLHIMLLTLWHVISQHGLQVDPGATMLDFDEERRRRLENCHDASKSQ